MSAVGEPDGWLFLRTDVVPERWRGRAVTVSMIPLLPGEAAAIARGGEAGDGASLGEEALIRLVVAGQSTEAIARALGTSTRSVQRRLAGIRKKVGATSNEALRMILKDRGFNELG